MNQHLFSRLNRIFNPNSVAVMGAGQSPDKVGHAIMDSLVTGRFPGRIFPVHPRFHEIMGHKVYRDIGELPEVPDLTVIALNQRLTVDAAARLREIGCGGAVALAGGYSEMGAQGRSLQDALREAAGDMPIIGPNTLGLLNARASLNVTFYPRELVPGRVSFLSQSGGIGLAFKGLAEDEGIGLSKWVGVGNRVNLEFHDLLAYLREDPDTDVIGLFIEGTSDPRSLIREIRTTTPKKPVLVFKAGRHENSDAVTVTHTGAAAGKNLVWRGALEQSGAVQVSSATEMITLCKALAIAPIPKGKRIGIFTHTAGPSITAWDILQSAPGCTLASLADHTLARVAEILGPSVPVVHKNPVDGAAGAFLTQPFYEIADAVLSDPSVDALLAIFCEHKNWEYPTDALINAAKKSAKPVVACFIGSRRKLEPDRGRLHANGIPVYTTPEEAAWGLSALLARITE